MSRLLALGAVTWPFHPVAGCSILSGGCPLDHSELISMDPQVSCLDVKGNKKGGGQCVTASLLIQDNCSESLQFAAGWTANGGKLIFAPGTGGHYDALESMQTASNHWETTATLGPQTIKFTVKTYPR
jgi:protein gp37